VEVFGNFSALDYFENLWIPWESSSAKYFLFFFGATNKSQMIGMSFLVPSVLYVNARVHERPTLLKLGLYYLQNIGKF
jgi:hypothetical protein